VGGSHSPNPEISDDGKTLTVSFDSAWAPPIAAYEKMQEQGFELCAMYYEPGCAFVGRWDDGYDDYYDLSGMSSDEVEKLLPTELDEYFGISESISEYEESEKDEVTQWYEAGVEECKLEPHEVKKI
jgi:hypothetical protein